MYYINKKDGSIAEIISNDVGKDKVMIQIGRSVQKVITTDELKSEWEQKEGERP